MSKEEVDFDSVKRDLEKTRKENSKLEEDKQEIMKTMDEKQAMVL